jgi:phosphomannomutase
MLESCTGMLETSNVQFGTSGARGLVTDFTPEVVGAFTQSFIEHMQSNFDFGSIAIAIDNRPSSPDIALASIKVMRQLGLQVDYYGVVPTPALALQAMKDNIPCIMVTGSHIPFDRNGLKFYRPDGEISKEDEQAILSCESPFVGFADIELPEVKSEAAHNYISRNKGLFASDTLEGKRIGLFEHSSAGRDLYADVFTALGAEVISLERTDTFVPIDTEAVSEEDKAKAKKWAEEHQLDAIFSTDGDGDRPLISDEQGNWLRGDIVGLMTAQYLGVEALAVPVSCNTAIEKSDLFKQVTRTRIGSPYVIAAFDELASFNSVAGFEANGGFLLGSDCTLNDLTLKALPTRDALLPGIVVIAGSEKQGKRISEWVESLPQRFTASDRIKEVPTEWSKAFLQEGERDVAALLTKIGLADATVENVSTIDGLRINLGCGNIVHLRPSGNAPELRCYAEADSEANAQSIVSKVLSHVQALAS